MTLFLRSDSDSGGGGRGDEPEGRSGGNFSNPEEGGGCEGREGQSHSGSSWVLFGWRYTPRQNHWGVENEEGNENGCFQFTEKTTRPFYQPNNEAWWLFLPNSRPRSQVLIIHAHMILNNSTFLPPVFLPSLLKLWRLPGISIKRNGNC